MWTKIKMALTNNVGLKLLAVLFSMALWLVVVNVDDPTQTKTFTATVQVLNEQVLSDTGKYYNIVDDNNTVSFRVTAKRSVIERLSNSDFVATADMNYLEENSRIPIDISVERYANQVSISSKQQYLEVTVGNEMSSKFVIDGETTGSPAEGCAVGEVTVSPNVVTVTGPAKTVSSINKVVAVADVTDMGSDITENVVPVLYDADGHQVDATKLSLSVTTVDVAVSIVNTKTVDINVQTSGTLADGLELESVTAEPTKLQIKGDGDSINDISSITIPSSVVNLSEITEDFSTTVDITTYLPKGVSLMDSTQAQVTVKVKLASQTTKVYDVPTANLTVNNLDSNCTATFPDTTVAISVTGLQKDLTGLDAATIAGSVDASGLTAGTHTVTVVINLDDLYEVATATVKIKIVDKPTN